MALSAYDVTGDEDLLACGVVLTPERLAAARLSQAPRGPLAGEVWFKRREAAKAAAHAIASTQSRAVYRGWLEVAAGLRPNKHRYPSDGPAVPDQATAVDRLAALRAKWGEAEWEATAAILGKMYAP